MNTAIEFNKSLVAAVEYHREWRKNNEWFYLPSQIDCLRYARSEAQEAADVVMRMNNDHHIRRRSNPADLEAELLAELCDTAAMIASVLLDDEVLVSVSSFLLESWYPLDDYVNKIIDDVSISSDSIVYHLSRSAALQPHRKMRLDMAGELASAVLFVSKTLDALTLTLESTGEFNPLIHALDYFHLKIESRRPADEQG